MKVTGGKPTADKQPFLRDLDIEVWMSEPDYAHRRGRGAGVVARGAARGPLLRHARLLRGDGAHAHAEPPERARQDLPDHPPERGPGSRARRASCTRATRRRRPKIEVTYKEKGAEKPTDGVARARAHRRDGAGAWCARSCRADRVSEIELQVEAKDDKEATRAVDALDGLVAPAGRRAVHDGAVVRPRRPRGGSPWS